jgi:CheY-like chemotaxis protein
MLVDDEKDHRDTLAAILAHHGLMITTCESGPEALARMDDVDSLDLIISDVSMPGMDGVEFARRARAQRPDVPVILVTGHDDVVDGVLATGAIALLKPYSPANLMALTDETIAAAKAPCPPGTAGDA